MDPTVTVIPPEPVPTKVRIEMDMETAQALRTALLFFGEKTADDKRLEQLWRALGGQGVQYAAGVAVYVKNPPLTPGASPILTLGKAER